jgi:hypothetical protein
MSERRRILLLSIAILVLVSLSAAILAIGILYRATFEQHRNRLIQMAQHRAEILATVAELDTGLHEEAIRGGPAGRELSELVEVYRHFSTFGDTGEFTLARLEGDQVVWLLRSRDDDADAERLTLLEAEAPTPIQRALRGESGSIAALDSRGTRVLAAYEPVPVLGWAVVAKIDVAEIREPFLRAASEQSSRSPHHRGRGMNVVTRRWSSASRRVAERTAELSKVNRGRAGVAERRRASAPPHVKSSEATAPISIQDLSGKLST